MAMSKTIAGFFICVIITCILPTVAVSIASFVIARENSAITCDANALVRLPTWLNVNGAVTLGCCIIAVGLYIVAITFRSALFAFLMYTVSGLNWGFMIAWNIVGAISLFRDSMACKDTNRPIFIMVVISLAFQWLAILSYLCSIRHIKKMHGNIAG